MSAVKIQGIIAKINQTLHVAGLQQCQATPVGIHCAFTTAEEASTFSKAISTNNATSAYQGFHKTSGRVWSLFCMSRKGNSAITKIYGIFNDAAIPGVKVVWEDL